MKKSILVAFAILLMAGLMTRCGKSGETPGDVVKAFHKKMEKGDNSVMDMLAKDMAAMIGDEKMATAVEEQSNDIKGKGGISGITINEETVNENDAVVRYTITYGNGETEDDKMHFVKEEGKWKVTMSK